MNSLDPERAYLALQTAYSGGPGSSSAARKRSRGNLTGAAAGDSSEAGAEQEQQEQQSSFHLEAQAGSSLLIKMQNSSYPRGQPRSPGRGSLPGLGQLTVGRFSISTEFALDYAVIVLAIVALAVSDRAVPRAAYIPKDLLPYVNYPLRPNTVPAWSVPVIAVVAPAALFAACCLLRRRRHAADKQHLLQLHHLVVGLMTSVMITGAITNCIKCPVGRLRPDFNARCWPDGKVLWTKEDAYGGWANCSGNPNSVEEGRKSFPSGHSSWSASGLCYAMWYLMDLLRPFDSLHPWRLVVATSPSLGAVAVGITRYVDYWHHWTDIVAGLVLGCFISWLVYRQHQARGHGELLQLDGAAGAGGLPEVQPLLNRPLEAERGLPL